MDVYLEQKVFHRIDVSHPGVRLVHNNPFIFIVDDFMNAAECAELIAAHHDGQPQSSATAPEQESLRTSTTVFPPAHEVAWLRERIAKVTNVSSAQLEPTKISRYCNGQFFKKHTDASFLHEKLWAYSAKLASVDEDGVQDPCRWPSRFCTCFLYLNDVETGGRTSFKWLDGQNSVPGAGIFTQSIEALSSGGCEATSTSMCTSDSDVASPELNFKPRAGSAVIHFPTTTLDCGCIPDPRTMHESEDAVDDKFIVQQFIWPVEIDLADDTWHEDVRREWAMTLVTSQQADSSGKEQAASQLVSETDADRTEVKVVSSLVEEPD